ncbi:adhesive plaque matrix protein-like [Penaeus chinensis]|uniref:adhesive plaque matrix protein-like n=1 Tax=Penaeus chinensis TaxID=139456 RepID=UPI001FB76DEF|nr:adhesive plaque matrix protein-like [Penaeus chinensis]
MAAALLRGLLLLALSRGLPLAAADKEGLPRDLPSIKYLKPNQNATKVTFYIFANNTDNIVTRSLDEKWYAVELSKNENRALVLRILPPVDSDFTCCTGVKLINFHASYEGKVQWNETCPEDLTEYCPGTESDPQLTQHRDTKDPPTQQLHLKAPSTVNPDRKAPSTVNPDRKAPSTENPDRKAPSTVNPDRKAPSTENPDRKAPSTINPDRKAPSTENPDRKAPSTQLSDSRYPSTEHLVTKAPSTQNPDVKAPSNVPDPGLSSSIESPTGVNVLLFVLAVATMLIALEI